MVKLVLLATVSLEWNKANLFSLVGADVDLSREKGAQQAIDAGRRLIKEAGIELGPSLYFSIETCDQND